MYNVNKSPEPFKIWTWVYRYPTSGWGRGQGKCKEIGKRKVRIRNEPSF